ncbi:hypothetical protein R3W88_000620 [Solanum pinnatisectum]|uniref:Uncharacterized protein n=1 Tax=Solanum pinnatisectum TaxID=50273 RepID=A0AAV9MGF8_9SOLN|nr:hypothetical protein R3W88_000620 [Solanum pinnatisectum]
MVKFWDSDNMVFRFGEVELTPTIDEVLASYESVGMCNKRKYQPDTDLLFPKIWVVLSIRTRKGTRSYALSRVLRQLGGKQELPQIEDMTRFVIDHENGEVAFTKKMLQLWKTRRVLGEPVPNRFRLECSKDYKEWLKKSLAGTIEPGPNVPHIIADCRHSEDAKVITQLKQEQQRARQCISELDDNMEQQIRLVEKFRHQERARLARDHLWVNKYVMWEEVSIAKRTRLGESSGGA